MQSKADIECAVVARLPIQLERRRKELVRIQQEIFGLEDVPVEVVKDITPWISLKFKTQTVVQMENKGYK